VASFGESDYKQSEAEGFINLFGLPIRQRHSWRAEKKKVV
jgi:hypothetical protein